MYRSRWRYWQSARQTEDESFSRELAQRLLALWDEELLEAWHAREQERLRWLLSLRPLLPTDTAASTRLRVRARIPRWMLRKWDAWTS
jgi:hypothetical protein